ncbi:unnamed protein product, partial [Closterium sp. NIES-54]
MAAWSAGISADLLGGALLPAADNGASRPLGIADRRSPPSCRHSFCSSPLPNSTLFSPGARDSPGVSCLVSVRAPLSRVRAISASAASSSDTDGPDRPSSRGGSFSRLYGRETVTLGDEEARRRGVQKSVMERGGPPVFQAAVEMHSRGRWTVHRNLAATVDALLSGKAPQVEVREMGQHGEVWVDGDAATAVGSTGRGSRGSSNSGGGGIPGASSGSAGTGLPQLGSWNEQGWQRLGVEGAMGVMGVREWDAAQPRGGGGRQSERFSAVRPSHAPSPSAAGRTAASPLGFASGGGSSGESSGSDTDSEGSDVDVYGDGGGSDTDGGGEQWGRSAMWWGGMASRSTSTAAGTTSSSASISAASSSAAAPSPSWSQGGSMPAALSAFAQATRSDNSTLLFLYQISEEHVEQVVEVMGLAPLITLTTDIAAADAVLALRSKLKGNAWLRGVAKFRHLPIYAVK